MGALSGAATCPLNRGELHHLADIFGSQSGRMHENLGSNTMAALGGVTSAPTSTSHLFRKRAPFPCSLTLHTLWLPEPPLQQKRRSSPFLLRTPRTNRDPAQALSPHRLAYHIVTCPADRGYSSEFVYLTSSSSGTHNSPPSLHVCQPPFSGIKGEEREGRGITKTKKKTERKQGKQLCCPSSP